MLRAIVAFLTLVLVAVPAHAWRIGGGGAITVSSGTGPTLTVPVLMQHVSSESNPFPGNGISGNNFKLRFPNPVQSGDVLVLGISYPHGSTPTITDNLGNTWPGTAACTADDGAGNMVSAIYVLPNSGAGTSAAPGTVTVAFGASLQPFQYTLSELNNIATSSPVNGCKGTAGITPASGLIDPGSFTPTTNNDSNGGNIIWNYNAVAITSTTHPTSWTAATIPSFTLLDGDLSTGPLFPHAAQWYRQTSQASVDPSITTAGDTNAFNSVSVALKIAIAGGSVASGIHINKILHYSFSTAANPVLPAPATGNLRVLVITYAGGTLSSVTDNDTGSSWTLEQDSNNPQMVIAFSANRAPLSTLQITMNWTPAAQSSVRFYDIQGAAAAPFDVAANNIPTTCPVGGNTSAAPSITPTTTNGLTIAGMPMGTGPTTAVVAPTNSVFDLTTYTGETDLDTMENADANGHYYNGSDLTAENWSWTTAAGTANCQGTEAVHFKGQ